MIDVYWTVIGLIGVASIAFICWAGGVISLAVVTVLDR